MATHEISFKIPEKFVLSQDIKFDIKSDGSLLGKLLISQGNVEWIPSKNSAKKHRLSWEKFAEMMETQGKVARIKKS